MKLYQLAPVLVFSFMSQTVFADVTASDVKERVDHGVAALNELMTDPATSVPKDLMHAATCIANIRIAKGGLIFGAESGEGLASCKLKNGRWSAPLFIELSGVSFGLQFGYDVADVTLISTKKNWRAEALDGSLKLTANAGLLAGPVGADLPPGAAYSLEEKVYAYSRAEGLYAGLTLEGSSLSRSDDYNAFVYNHLVPERILVGGAPVTPLVRPYVLNVEHFARQ